ncbi:right-handed parallel beta-helix repeat-containing protein [Methylocystis iwaonis]|uniref:right-handed parallel beta-helix repeat-containing protein n=1 Tax=Methylocystis iwaonis TaxID=2885079 RepID=UPI002E7B3B27|nr:right-handed parallel beta-helix repeat-containing protein [Methylocystis iwaonis]
MKRFLTALALSLLAFSSPTQAVVIASVSDYGANGADANDDTAAFNNCLAANKTCWVDAGTYIVGNVHMNSGNRLQGLAVQQYGMDNATNTATRPILKGKVGAAYLLDVTSVTDGGAIVGLFLDCASSNMTGISHGSFSLSIDNLTVVNCGVGLGGVNAPYTSFMRITNSTFGANNTGILNIVDSYLSNVDFANNWGPGLDLRSGSNANTITNTRFEWNNGPGISTWASGADAAFGNNVSNCFFDRNGKAAIVLEHAINWNISNNFFYRNARLATVASENAQITMANSSKITITGGSSETGKDNDGAGARTPSYVISYGSGNSYFALRGLIAGGKYSATNIHGGYTVAPTLGAAPTTGSLIDPIY